MDATPGFHEHASGLLVPEVHARERECWPRADWRHIEAATKFLESRGVRFQFACTHPRCKGQAMVMDVRGPEPRLVCEHAIRVWSRTI